MIRWRWTYLPNDRHIRYKLLDTMQFLVGVTLTTIFRIGDIVALIALEYPKSSSSHCNDHLRINHSRFKTRYPWIAARPELPVHGWSSNVRS